MKTYMVKHPRHGLLTWASGESPFIAWSIFLSGKGMKVSDVNIEFFRGQGYRMVPVEVTETEGQEC